MEQFNLEQVIEIAHIAVIMAEGDPVNEMYQSNMSYINRTETIAHWALEFYNKYKDVFWEDLLDEGVEDFPPSVMCWDDAIKYYVKQKVNNYIL